MNNYSYVLILATKIMPSWGIMYYTGKPRTASEPASSKILYLGPKHHTSLSS